MLIMLARHIHQLTLSCTSGHSQRQGTWLSWWQCLLNYQFRTMACHMQPITPPFQQLSATGVTMINIPWLLRWSLQWWALEFYRTSKWAEDKSPSRYMTKHIIINTGSTRVLHINTLLLLGGYINRVIVRWYIWLFKQQQYERASNQLRSAFRLVCRRGHRLGHARRRSRQPAQQRHRRSEAIARWHALHEQCSAPCKGPSHDEWWLQQAHIFYPVYNKDGQSDQVIQ